jgi:hypothetical protein
MTATRGNLGEGSAEVSVSDGAAGSLVCTARSQTVSLLRPWVKRAFSSRLQRVPNPTRSSLRRAL